MMSAKFISILLVAMFFDVAPVPSGCSCSDDNSINLRPYDEYDAAEARDAEVDAAAK
jgi:hypothetical protein